MEAASELFNRVLDGLIGDFLPLVGFTIWDTQLNKVTMTILVIIGLMVIPNLFAAKIATGRLSLADWLGAFVAPTLIGVLIYFTGDNESGLLSELHHLLPKFGLVTCLVLVPLHLFSAWVMYRKQVNQPDNAAESSTNQREFVLRALISGMVCIAAMLLGIWVVAVLVLAPIFVQLFVKLMRASVVTQLP